MSSDKHINDLLSEQLIRYSQVWEDYELLIEGLEINPEDNVLSICSAGCNALALLAQDVKSVTAVDLNSAQTSVLQLKIAAIALLPYEQFVVLMGARTGDDRWDLYNFIRADMPEQAQAFWDNNREIIENGIIHSGRLEKYIRGFQETAVNGILDPDSLANFLDYRNPDMQSEQYDEVFGDSRFAERFMEYTGQKRLQEEGRDPVQFKFVEVEDTGRIFLDRFRSVCTRQSARDNFYLEYYLTSRYSDLRRGPLYLRPEMYLRLRQRLDRLTVVTGGVNVVVEERPEGFFTKANLSDIFEYLSDDETQGLFELLGTKMAKGGRLGYWNLLVPRSRPENLAHMLEPRRELAEALWKKDRNFFYGAFHIDEVIAD